MNTLSSPNPLTKHFRQPTIFMKLPSNGRFWDEDSIEIPVTGELPVYPMTTKDEISLRTPDALMNGAGVVSVIQSCIPSIKNAWTTPSIDVDPILISIRIASYGSSMDIEPKCPHCGQSNTYAVDLHQVLGSLQIPNYDEMLTINELTFRFKPQSYLSVNMTNKASFEEQKLLESIGDLSLDEELRKSEIANHLSRLNDLNMKVITDSIESITLDDGTKVTNTAYIEEFIKNTDGVTIKTIRQWLENAAKIAAIKPVQIQCANEECNLSFQATLTFDYSHFFE